jgi:hypothetical protein
MTVSVASDPIAFLLDTTWDSLPTVVRHATIRCLVDLVGALAAGRRTPLSAIVRGPRRDGLRRRPGHASCSMGAVSAPQAPRSRRA